MKDLYDLVISSYKNEIVTLKSEIYFLREQIKEKNCWIGNFLCSKPKVDKVQEKDHQNINSR